MNDNDGSRNNLQLVRELFNGNVKNVARYSKFYADDVVRHGPETGKSDRGIAELIETDKEFTNRFGPLRTTVEQIFGHQDRVVVHWYASGQVEKKEFGFSGQSILRLENNKIAEAWISWDTHALLAQLNSKTLDKPKSEKEEQEEKNIQLVRCRLDGDVKDVERYPNFFADDIVRHGPATGEIVKGLDALMHADREYLKNFDQVRGTIEKIFAYEDKVVAHWRISGKEMGSEKEFSFLGQSTLRIENNKIAESWISWDRLGLLAQVNSEELHQQSYNKKNISVVMGLLEGDLTNLERYYNFFSDDVVRHGPTPGERVEGLQALMAADEIDVRGRGPIHGAVEQIFADDDRVVAHWRVWGQLEPSELSSPSNNNKLTVAGQSIYRFKDGKIAELWISWDRLGLDDQISNLKERSSSRIIQKAPSLTPRERDCLRALLQLKTAKETAADLELSFRTVEYYFENIKFKLDCGTKRELFVAAQTLQKAQLL